jgi:D-alanyl-D-alanine dipeptidase
MNLFEIAPMVMTGAMCAYDAMGTNSLPPKTICAYTSSAITGISKALAVSAIYRYRNVIGDQ